MTITPFGLIFITLGFTLLVARPAWLLPLLIVSAVLQAFAVAIINPAALKVGLGITPWLFVCSLIFVHLIVIIIRNRRIELGASRTVKVLFWGWMIFIAWCVLSAFTLPFLFEGTPVHVLNDVFNNKIWDSPPDKWGNPFTLSSDSPLQPLVWNHVSALLAINIAIIGMLLVYVLQLGKDAKTIEHLMFGLIVAALVSLSITICQLFELIGTTSTLTIILQKSLNPSYSQGDILGRINWPFSEPSYASVWYASVSMGGLAIHLFTKRSWFGILFFIEGLCGLLISRGGTGVAGFGLTLLVLSVSLPVFLWKKISLRPVLWRLTPLVVSISLTVIIYEIARQTHPNLPDIYSSAQFILKNRILGPIEWRGQSNLDAITITRDTWGLGVGLGSNRASSYVLSMMSDIGIFGLALFLALLTYQVYLVACNSTTDNALKAFILGGTICMFSGMMMGVPDLTFPAWWIWLIAGFGFLASRQHFGSVQSE